MKESELTALKDEIGLFLSWNTGDVQPLCDKADKVLKDSASILASSENFIEEAVAFVLSGDAL